MTMPSANSAKSILLRAAGHPSILAIGLILLVAVFGQHISPFDPEAASPATRLIAPTWVHPFGTDENGIDIFSRVLSSFQIDIFVALLGTVLSVLVGAPLGVVLGYFEGRSKSVASRWATEVALRLVDVIQAFPVFILAMVLVSAAGSSIFNIVGAIAFVNGPVFLRLVRSEMLALRKQPYAEAAIAIGASPWRVGFVHLLPNALPAVVSQVSVTIGFSILLTAGLSFVGAGVDPPTPELGAMISSGSKFMILGQWWPSLFPGLALGLIVFCFANGGDRLQELLTPRRTVALSSNPRPPSVTNVGAAPGEADETALEVTNLTISAGYNRILDRVNLSLARGESVAIVGPAGAGKSVLAQALIGMFDQQTGVEVSGSITVNGANLASLPHEARRCLRGTAIVPLFSNAKTVLNPMVRVGDMMRLAYAAHCVGPDTDIDARLVGLLRDVGINDPQRRLRAFPHELSGGMAQRICIALALMHRPAVLIADEPTAGLDVTVQRQVLDLMSELTRSHGMAQLIVTRDLGIAAHYCDRIIVMRDGSIVESGPSRDMFCRPKTEFTRQLFVRSGARLAYSE